jgi:Eukaryotic glutathione synthase, ATP binding domain
MLRSFGHSPYVIKNGLHLEKLKALQPVFNKLYDRISQDEEWLNNTVFKNIARQCAWTQREMQAYNKSLRALKSKPTLLLSNSIYLSPEETNDDFTLIVTNVQAGEPFQVQLAYDFQRSVYTKGLQKGPLAMVTSTLARAARMVHQHKPCIAILSKPSEKLALRTRADVLGVSAR